MAFKFSHIPEMKPYEDSDFDVEGMDPNIIIKANSDDFMMASHLLN